MNNLEYLNEIAKSNRPVKVKSRGLSTSLIIKLVVIGIIIFAILAAVGSIASNNATKSSDLTNRLFSRTAAVNTVIKNYSRSLKSSQLRSITTSLSSTLTAGTNNLTNYYAATGMDSTLNPELVEEENAIITEFDLTLTNAMLNGILDRIYVSQVQLQVSLLISLISENAQRTKSEALLSVLEPYYNNLYVIYNELESYTSR